MTEKEWRKREDELTKEFDTAIRHAEYRILERDSVITGQGLVIKKLEEQVGFLERYISVLYEVFID